MKLKTNMFAKDQRVVKDKYRDAYDAMEWGEGSMKKVEKKEGDKTIISFK
jgi:hypothetical protein